MNNYDFESLKYWKWAAVLSGTTAFIYLLQCLLLSMFHGTSSYLISMSTAAPQAWPFSMIFFYTALSSFILFILFAIAGVLTSRGMNSGVIMCMILSIFVILIIFFFSIMIAPPLPYSLGLFALNFATSPQAILSAFNIYYSAKALNRRFHGIVMSLWRFLACSTQYATSIVLEVLAILSAAGYYYLTFMLPAPTYPMSKEVLSIPSPDLLIVTCICLMTSFIFLFSSAYHMFKNDEDAISRKRVYALTGIALLPLLVVVFAVPIVGVAIGVLMFPVTLASVGFVMAIPKKYYPSTIEIPRIEKPKEEYMALRERVTSSTTGPRRTIYCRYCGRIIPADSIYCEYCGRRLR